MIQIHLMLWGLPVTSTCPLPEIVEWGQTPGYTLLHTQVCPGSSRDSRIDDLLTDWYSSDQKYFLVRGQKEQSITRHYIFGYEAFVLLVWTKIFWVLYFAVLVNQINKPVIIFVEGFIDVSSCWACCIRPWGLFCGRDPREVCVREEPVKGSK